MPRKPGTKRIEAVAAGRSVFAHSVVDVPETGVVNKLGIETRVVKWAIYNKKIGGFMFKGAWYNSPIFALTLEERATCPASCEQWGRCYGDNMMYAKRYRHGPELLVAIEHDLASIAGVFRQFVVRLHVLGDFYSVEYVEFWQRMLKLHDGLRVYGYTHWQHDTPIGKAVSAMVLDNLDRVSILRSDRKCADDPLPAAWVVNADATQPIAGSRICPQEQGKVRDCGSCGWCMTGKLSVTFLDHGAEVQQQKGIERRKLAVLSA